MFLVHDSNNLNLKFENLDEEMDYFIFKNEEASVASPLPLL